MKNTFDKIYLLLPVLLWPIVFIEFKSVFVYAMFFATLLLAVLSLLRYRKFLPFTKSSGPNIILTVGILAAIILYLIFYFGYFASAIVGPKGSVLDVYSMLYAQNPKLVLGILLIFIGIFEEIYWRGGVQSFAEKRIKILKGSPWLISTLYYAAVHLFTLNPILAVSAFFVGLVTSLVAYKYGLIASMITHVLWIEAVVVFLPIGV